MKTFTQHIIDLKWNYDAGIRTFVIDVSYGFTQQPSSIGTSWGRELHCASDGLGTWTLRDVAITAPGYPGTEHLAGRIVTSATVERGRDLCALLERGLDEARAIQHTIDEMVA